MSSPGVRRRKDKNEEQDKEPSNAKDASSTSVRSRRLTKNEFKERTSKLDFSEKNMKESEFRGFFNLLTMALIWFFVATQARKLVLEGNILQEFVISQRDQ
jgi:hypothetical protein